MMTGESRWNFTWVGAVKISIWFLGGFLLALKGNTREKYHYVPFSHQQCVST